MRMLAISLRDNPLRRKLPPWLSFIPSDDPKDNHYPGACLEELEGSANVVKAASVAWRTLTHDAERWFCELDWMVDGIRE